MNRSRIIELTELHNRLGVFADRAEAGEVLAGMLSDLASRQPLVDALYCAHVRRLELRRRGSLPPVVGCR